MGRQKAFIGTRSRVARLVDKVDGVGARGAVLVDLEIAGGQAERSQDQVPQVLQLTCRGSTEVRVNRRSGGTWRGAYRQLPNISSFSFSFFSWIC